MIIIILMCKNKTEQLIFANAAGSASVSMWVLCGYFVGAV